MGLFDKKKKKKKNSVTLDDDTIRNSTVALIGCGPAGMSFLHALQKRKMEGKAIPTVTCYERAFSVGGIWRNVPSDDPKRRMETNQCLMYEDLWCTTPKELMEYYDYTFDDHFQRATPTYLPREDILNYIIARNSVDGALDSVKLGRLVTNVNFNSTTNQFTVTIQNLMSGKCTSVQFDKCIWSAGINGKPHRPDDVLAALNGFTGKILHSVEATKENHFHQHVLDKRVFIVGDATSAEDLALQSIKLGSKHVYISSRSGEGVACDTFACPKGSVTVIDGPPCKVLNGNTIKCHEVYWSVKKEKYRKDDEAQPTEVKDIDTIVLATGYEANLDFLSESLQFDDEAEWSVSKGWNMDNNALSLSLGKVTPSQTLEGGNACYPDVYRGILISNPNMMFIHELEHSTCPILELDVLAHLIVAYLVGENDIPTKEEMHKANQKQLEAEMQLPWLRANLDPLYQAEIDDCDDQHWMNNPTDERVLNMNKMVHELAIKRLARDMKDAKYAISFGDWKELNKNGKKVVNLLVALDHSHKNLNGNCSTYRDCHLKESVSFITGTKAVEMPGLWLDLKPKGGSKNTTLQSIEGK